jgi:hypothetical protein
VIGKGKYGTIRVCGEGVAKVVDIGGKSQGCRRQAYREHVVAILQSLLLLGEVTPHFPFHFGATMDIQDRGMGFTLFMERFETNLEGEPSVLIQSKDWVHMVLQVFHACVALSNVFEVVHNDLYPRNVLVRRYSSTRPRLISYLVEGVPYRADCPFLCTVTDYGISSGRLVEAAEAPEVLSSTQKVPLQRPFSLVPPASHILQYEPLLPPYSRDPYSLFKCVFYRQARMPSATFAVKLWSMDAMTRMDASLADFHKPSSQLSLFHHLFHSNNLKRFGLGDALDRSNSYPADPYFFVLDPSEQRTPLKKKAWEALKSLFEEDSGWACSLRDFKKISRPRTNPKANEPNEI